MKVHEVTQPGPYWCSHDLGYWIPKGSTYESRWIVLHFRDGEFYLGGWEQPINLSEIPDYVDLVGPLEPPKSL